MGLLREPLSRHRYALGAAALILSQHLVVAGTFRAAGVPLVTDAEFWLIPLRRLAALPDLNPVVAALVFAFSLAVAWALAELSWRRGGQTGDAAAFAMFAILPGLQLPAVAAIAILPHRLRSAETPDDPGDDAPDNTARHVVQGVLAGVALIVLAVLVSAVTFGAYGWGLFVLTPFTVGMTTGYIANRSRSLSIGRTNWAVLGAAALGSLALILFALEGLVCILLAAPLGAAVAIVGGAVGRGLALAGHRRGKPFLCVALLPAVFALEAAMPPEAPIATDQSIEIAASPVMVWSALTSSAPIGLPPGWVGRAGLAYPLRGHIVGQRVGGERVGHFSTGAALERITRWEPGRRLAFAVVRQPPAMEEMSPWRRVHAPHVTGYFETGETRFELEPLAGGRTRLTARASHVLRLDPVLYWEPLARWAVRSNTARVLDHIRARAESGAAAR